MKKLIIIFSFLSVYVVLMSQSFMMNPYGRLGAKLLNGKWNAIIDPFGRGENVKFYQNKTPQSKGEFVEYSFKNGLKLDVPGDFNSQLPELKYYEGNIWYQRYFNFNKIAGKRQFLYFAGASYHSTVWLNGVQIGKHEGGFTPFQFEISSLLKEGENDLIVLINNNRKADGIPAMNFDWWNYGGITRDVFVIETPTVYVIDYTVQLKKGVQNKFSVRIQLDGNKTSQQVELSIPELKIKTQLKTNEEGYVVVEMVAKPQLWETDNPKMYAVRIATANDTVNDEIGFRTIETKGTDILLNGKPIFLKGVNFHEEIPQRMGRAYSEADAATILSEVKALGCNFVRTAHYPQNEHIVRMSEKMGFLIWEEIPLWQGINFSNPVVLAKAKTMLQEMIYRDKNRAGVIIWSIANETWPSAYRDEVLTELVALTRKLDDTRLVGAAFDNPKFDETTSTFNLVDKVSQVVDVVGVNKYMGWYMPYPKDLEKIKWNVATDKPLIISEFGCEALYGQQGPSDVAQSWSEEYQEDLYLKNIAMFKNIPNLRGTSPWVLFDFRSPNRWLPLHQDGWNRKGLISDKGQRKKAWYVMKAYYEGK